MLLLCFCLPMCSVAELPLCSFCFVLSMDKDFCVASLLANKSYILVIQVYFPHYGRPRLHHSTLVSACAAVLPVPHPFQGSLVFMQPLCSGEEQASDRKKSLTLSRPPPTDFTDKLLERWKSVLFMDFIIYEKMEVRKRRQPKARCLVARLPA